MGHSENLPTYAPDYLVLHIKEHR